MDSEGEQNTLSRELQVKLRKRDYTFERTKEPLKMIESKEFLKYKDNTAEDSEKIKPRLQERKTVDFRFDSPIFAPPADDRFIDDCHMIDWHDRSIVRSIERVIRTTRL